MNRNNAQSDDGYKRQMKCHDSYPLKSEYSGPMGRFIEAVDPF